MEVPSNHSAGSSEILPPETDAITRSEAKPISFHVAWQYAAPIQKGTFLILSAGSVGSWFLFALGQFFQTRGVQSMLTSRVFLVVAVVFPALWVWQVGFLFKPCHWKWIASGITLILLVSAYALDRAFPMSKPSTASIVQHDQSQPTENLATTDKPKATGSDASLPSAQPRPNVSIGRIRQKDGGKAKDSGGPPPSPTQTQLQAPEQQREGIPLKVVIWGGRQLPCIAVTNDSDRLAEKIAWQLVMFRTTDQAFLSYSPQNIGYVKAHSKSACYEMNLNAMAGRSGTPLVSTGETYVGSMIVDCPTCRGSGLIVSFTWGVSGWFYELPKGWFLPNGDPNSKEVVSRYIDEINNSITPDKRVEIR